MFMSKPDEDRVCREDDFLRRLMDPREELDIRVAARLSMDAGERFPRWVLVDHLLLYAESGEFDVHLGGAPHRLSAGACLWLQPGTEYYLQARAGAQDAILLYSRFNVGGYPCWRTSTSVVPGRLGNFSAGAMRELLAGNFSESPSTKLRLRALLTVLFSRLLEERRARRAPGTFDLSEQFRILEYVRTHISGRLFATRMARDLGYNPDYFARVFKRSFGATPRSFIKKQRIEASLPHLSRLSLSVSQVAEKLGYRNVFYFSRQFKEVMGMSPKQWRRGNVF